MFIAILMGLLASFCVSMPAILRSTFPNVSWSLPVFVLGIAAVSVIIQRFFIDRRPGERTYDGLADIFIHVHGPGKADSSLRWIMRGAISFLFTLFGGIVGPEGVAIETCHGVALRFRSRSSRWFEQRRRTDASVAISAGIAASFGSPFAAVLLPLELGLGGRTISTAIAALTAFIGIKFLPLSPAKFDIAGVLYGFRFSSYTEWLTILGIAILAGLVCVLLIRFFRYTQESLLDLFQTQTWMRVMAGGVLLFLVIYTNKDAHLPVWTLLEQVLWSKRAVSEVSFLFISQLLSLALVVSAFGTIGIFWPLFALGGAFGYLVDFSIFQSIPGFSAVAGIAGSVAFLGAILGAPLSAAVLAFELTQNIHILLPCLLAGFVARQIRFYVTPETLIEKDLEARGITLINGRQSAVLESIQAKDAMVTDFETVHEREQVAELFSRLLKFRYPFIPVVNGEGHYVGLLTADMIQEGWELQGQNSANSPLSTLLEAKDLLYRAKFKAPVVKLTDRLTGTSGLFEEIPCLPVLGEDNKVLGLLFVYNVRLAYDREVAQQSLSFQSKIN